MRTLFTKIIIAGCLSFGTAAYSADNTTQNLVRDGGIEKWNEVSPGSGIYDSLTLKRKWQMSTTENGNLLVPSIFSQLAANDFIMKMETTDVFSGKTSLRFNGAAYLEKASEDAYKTRSGDIYVVRYMVKGKGTTTMYLTVYGGGAAQILERKGTPIADKWTMIEERILVGGASPTTIYPRLTASEEMLIDDVFVGRELREDETVDAAMVPKECSERIAFASPMANAPVIDGKLDDECWKSAVPFSGFRLHSDNTCLAPQQAFFRVLYDENNLYFGIEIMLPDAERVLEKLKENPLKDKLGKPMDKTSDVFSGRQSVELFIQPPGQERYIQCVVSLDGYRYDGVGMDASWNGKWTYGISVGKDRWFLEMMIPASDLKLEKIPSTEGWRLNVTQNTEAMYSTWSATGNNFHNPFAFGTLVTKDFSQWRKEKLQEWGVVRKKATEKADKSGLSFADRLERIEQFTKTLPAKTDGDKLDWETVTKVYAQMNFVDAVYRSMNAEMMYADFNQSKK